MDTHSQLADEIEKALSYIEQADGLLITAGAGMGVDSGLPDFRGEDGFWKAYPALKRSGVQFHDIASPDAFQANPLQAWGFYGHRLNLYRNTIPHAGFGLLRALERQIPNGAFIFTSNVDGQFQKAGFSEAQIVECHGSIHHLQCMHGCMDHVWSAKEFEPVTDDHACKLTSVFPHCPFCGEIARPNILMFNDWKWIEHRKTMQHNRYKEWRKKVERLLIIEIGAGTGIPTVRNFSEHQQGVLIRINPNDASIPNNKKGVSLEMGGLVGLQMLAKLL